jgi:hypothetical protein
MRWRIWISLLLWLTGACAPSDSGIEGWITAGPACPVMQVGVPCPDQPYVGTLSFFTKSGRLPAGRVTAGADGYYRISLSPGAYIIHPESPGALPSGSELVVAVRPHEFTRQDIVYDTGIR